MKRYRHLSVSILMMVFIVSFVSFAANAATTFMSGNLKYSVLSATDRTVRVDGFDTVPTSDTALSIPATVTSGGVTYTVTQIKTAAFRNVNAITSVTIGRNIETVGNNAFRNCDGLRSVNNDSNTLLTEVPEGCFNDCDNLTTVVLPGSLTTIGGSNVGAFESCDRLTTVNFDQLTSLQTIGNSAFKECSALTGLTLPDTLTTIGDNAFADCAGITHVNIPNSLTSMGGYAFRNCDGLQTISSGSSCALTNLPSGCFFGCDSLTAAQLPASLESIDGSLFGVFAYCYQLADVNFSELTSLRTIGGYAFYNCRSLSRIELPASLETIGNMTFSGCDSLTEVILPRSSAPTVDTFSFDRFTVTVYVPLGATGYEENKWEDYHVVYGDGSTVTNTPPPMPTVTLSGSTEIGGSTESGSAETGAAGFVERLYTVALGRSSDPNGQAAWTNTSGENTGADVARGFLYSSEFLNRDVSDEDFVRVLYRTFFDREGEEAGVNSWVAALAGGASKEDVIEGFINSTEWANLCLRYGIPSGGAGVPNIEVEPNQQTIDFCTRLYTTCLNRDADPDGLMAWARQLANRRDSGSGAARGFFFSNEFINQNVSNGEYVIRLYRTFMGREPDESGYNAWVAQLNEGVSRDTVFEGFAQSPEFTRICAGYGIVR